MLVTLALLFVPPERLPAPRPALDLASLVRKPTNEAAAVARRYDADRGSLARTYPVPMSPARTARLRKFESDWLAALKAVETADLSPAAREELASLRGRVASDLRELERQSESDLGIAGLMPFAPIIVGLDETRRRFDPIDPVKAAGTLAALPKQIADMQAKVKPGETNRDLLARAADGVGRLRTTLKNWHAFYDGYDPLFSWWTAHPNKQADAALDSYAKFLTDAAKKASEGTPPPAVKLPPVPGGPSDAPDLNALLARKPSEMVAVFDRFTGGERGRFRGVGNDRDTARFLPALAEIDFDKLSLDAKIDYVLLRTLLERNAARAALRDSARPPSPRDNTGINGRPIGREALQVELTGEMVPYTPEEMIDLARKELAWCEGEMKKASRQMGLGDDWAKAVELVKTKHVQPGEQPELIRRLAYEAIDYLKANDLVTVPPLAAETWRMEMMTPERQLFSPFFTGGEVISVAFPTNAMSHDAKLQSMRGNNPHFSRATVHHELIPGHHLQGFATSREKTHRAIFNTPFWGEGWACYWEMVLYARGFAVTPEDRIGFLVWRTHRCARVIFSLGYHLGTMTPRQCVNLLTSRVGFDEENALAEVRRSFTGGYGPLYQAGYLIGAMQLRALRHELVEGGKMTDRQFHDAILRENRIPIEMVRAALTGRAPARDQAAGWKFGWSAPTW